MEARRPIAWGARTVNAFAMLVSISSIFILFLNPFLGWPWWAPAAILAVAQTVGIVSVRRMAIVEYQIPRRPLDTTLVVALVMVAAGAFCALWMAMHEAVWNGRLWW